MSLLHEERRRARRRATRRRRYGPADFREYRGRPVAYAREVLGLDLTAEQDAILTAAADHGRVLVPSGHNVGKTVAGAALINYRHDCYRPGVVLSTAPTKRQVDSILWKEVRKLRSRAGLGGFDGPKISRMSTAPDHFAEGFTARDGTRFQGQHEAGVFIVFDEGEGVDPVFYEAAETMLGGESYGIVVFYNPTLQSGPTVEAESSGDWKVIRVSCVDHPNIAVELANERDGGNRPVPFPNAIRLGRLREMLAKWSDPLAREDEKQPTDVQLAEGEWYRPRPIAQCRLLGLRPSSAFDEVWSQALWEAVCRNSIELKPHWPVQIGCDVAWYGDDDTSIHVRQGMCSLHHESHNGWAPQQTAGRLKQLAHHFAAGRNPKRTPVLVDLIGMGAAVMSHADDYLFVGVNVQARGERPDEYPDLRSELWFDPAQIAKDSGRLMDVSRLTDEAKREIGRQLCAVKYRIDSAGRQEVEDKALTKQRIGRSPDDADAFNLAWKVYRPAVERAA